jgi:F420-non-reducing hydrogenase large subunit
MGQVINIQPITRIEGHARVAIHLDDAGNVADAKFHVMALRGFEKFCEGRPVEEMPRIVNRICGICPWNHHLSSVKATDGVYGVTPPPTAVKLRRLAQHLAWIPDKLLHFYFLAAPDFVLGPDADPAVRNVIGIAQAAPELAKKVVHYRQQGAMLLERWLGKVIHPVAAVTGGFSRPLLEEERQRFLAETREQLEFAKFTINHAKTEVFPKYLETVKSLGVINTGFIGTVTEDGTHDIYDGKIRLMKPDGTYDDFPYEDYTDHLGEHIEPWTYGKMPFAKKWADGQFSMDLENPQGIYRSNALSRINVCDQIGTPEAQKELEEFRGQFGRPAQLTLLYHWARLIELVNNCERAIELLEDPEITGRDIRAKVEVKAGEGVGCVEAPRGTLIHHYAGDENGMITKANLIVGTTHNQAPINMSIKQAATQLIKDGTYDQGVLNRVEMAIRAYDP